MPREVNEHFELPLQPLTTVPSSSTDIPPVSTPAKDETPKSPPKPTTPVKLKCQERNSFIPAKRTTQVPPKFKE